jgi:hypothetical protein
MEGWFDISAFAVVAPMMLIGATMVAIPVEGSLSKDSSISDKLLNIAIAMMVIGIIGLFATCDGPKKTTDTNTTTVIKQ